MPQQTFGLRHWHTVQDMPGSGDTAHDVKLAVPVKLQFSTPSAAVVVVTLRATRRFGAVVCAPPVALAAGQRPGAVDAEHASAAAHVSQPELLLPPAAVNDAGNDTAETRSFSIGLRASARSDLFPDGEPMLVRVRSLQS